MGAIFVSILIVKEVLSPAMVNQTDVRHTVGEIVVNILIVITVLCPVMENQTDVLHTVEETFVLTVLTVNHYLITKNYVECVLKKHTQMILSLNL